MAGRRIFRPRGEMSRDRSKIGDTIAIVTVLENRSWIPVPWMLVEDLLPRRALIHSPPNLQITGRRLQLVSFRGQGEEDDHVSIEMQLPRVLSAGAAGGRDGRRVWAYRRYRVLSEPSFLLVVPEVVPLEGFDIASRRPIGEVRMRIGCSKIRRGSPACAATRRAIRSTECTGGRQRGRECFRANLRAVDGGRGDAPD